MKLNRKGDETVVKPTVLFVDGMRNERIRRTAKVGETSKKVHESRLKYCGHVLRREE